MSDPKKSAPITVSRGIRNNNPLNIRHGRSQWVGMRAVQTDKAFVQFTERVYGYRAALVLLKRYIESGANTLGKIIARWAPSSDGNNTQAYIGYVCRSTGIDASQPLCFDDKETIISIVTSMAQVESGIVEERERVEEGYVRAVQLTVNS